MTGAGATARTPESAPLRATRRRARFHRLRVSEIRALTEDAIEVAFAVPEVLAADYDYAAGQYLALRATIAGRELRRSYSICQAPVSGELRVAIKRDRGGAFSSWAHSSLEVGDELDVMSPQGTFVTDISAAEGRHYAAIAAGSGITPLMALARTILAGTERARFTLVYTNRTVLDTMFLEELSDLKDAYPARLALHHVLSREDRGAPLLSGRIDAEKLGLLLDHLVPPAHVDEWFLCGPIGLVDMSRTELASRGVTPESVRFELFSTGRPQAALDGAARRVDRDDDGEKITITFTLDGRQAIVQSPVNAAESVLNAALRVRNDTPYACAGGVCGTCRAKVVEGSVQMTENYALEPDEIAAGYVLTCQSHPTSAAITVDYDG